MTGFKIVIHKSTCFQHTYMLQYFHSTHVKTDFVLLHVFCCDTHFPPFGPHAYSVACRGVARRERRRCERIDQNRTQSCFGAEVLVLLRNGSSSAVQRFAKWLSTNFPKSICTRLTKHVGRRSQNGNNEMTSIEIVQARSQRNAESEREARGVEAG